MLYLAMSKKPKARARGTLWESDPTLYYLSVRRFEYIPIPLHSQLNAKLFMHADMSHVMRVVSE
jgi:hypothetical protein